MPKLINLELTAGGATISTVQLTSIFSACPGLRRLRLGHHPVRETTGNDFVPAPLRHLEVIYLESPAMSCGLPLIYPVSESLRLSLAGVAFRADEIFIDSIVYLSPHCTITALQLEGYKLSPHGLHTLLCSLPQLQIVSLQKTFLSTLMALALWVIDPSGSGDEIDTMCSSPRVIWLKECMIIDESDLRLLVAVRPLEQLKLEGCCITGFGLALGAKALCEYLRGSISDLCIKD